MDAALIAAVASGSALLLGAMVVGATELIKRLFDRDFKAATIITVSAVVGGLSGLFLFADLGFALGLVVGLASSGVITSLQKFGTGTNSVPTKLT